MTSKKHDDFEHDVKLDVEARVRQGVKAVLEEVLQDERTQHLEAGATGNSLPPPAPSATATTSATS